VSDALAAPAAGYFETLYQKAPFGYLVTDRDDVVTRVNATLLDWIGVEARQLLGRQFSALLAPGSQLLYETRHLPVLRLQGFSREVLLQLVKGDGSYLHVLINAAHVEVDGDTPSEVRIGVLDASSRVNYERELLATQRSAEGLATRVSVLQNASVAFAASGSEAEIAETLSTILEDALAAASTCVAVLRDSGDLEVIAGVNLLDGLIPDDDKLLGETVLASEAPVVVSTGDADRERFPSVVAALIEARLQTVAVFPIMNDATPLGVAAAFFGRERSFPASDVEVVLSVARQANQVLTRMRAQEQLAYAALHDQLTGLANRAQIRDTISSGLLAAAEGSHPFSVMFVDLDGFKAVNDQLGHHVGDSILREVAGRLTASVRGSDIVGRYGGDEFVVICADTTGHDAAAISARIHREIRAPFATAEGFAISASIGIAVCEPSSSEISTDHLITVADAAMYESKRLGRDRTTRVQL
jgi:diguanylate cyclase (GGDEF)-like protein/PAS domain S-box-containing protein